MHPPTDNLYKFLAISGLLVVGFSIYVPLLRYLEFNRVNTRVGEMYRQTFEIALVLDDEAKADNYCAHYEAYKKLNGPPPMPDPCPEVVSANAKGSTARIERTRLQALIEPLEIERKFLWQEIRIFILIGLAGIATGVALCASGFWFWYFRLQRFQDASVRSAGLSTGRFGARDRKK